MEEKDETMGTYATKYYQAIDLIVKKYSLRDSFKILDVGTGTGQTTSLFKTKHNKVIGVDIVDRRGAQYVNNFDFQLENGLELSFADESFDLVVSFDVIEHIKDAQRFVKEMMRVLKIGGKILIGTPSRLRISSRLQMMLGKKITFPRYYGTSKESGDVVHVHEYTMEELKEILGGCGANILKARGFLLGMYLVGGRGQGFLQAPRFLTNFAQHLFILGVKQSVL
ncbi:MAG: class I SAM-dependent methyltransferase [Candidatus Omnitrophica bacterium]|nr:class I SAM-dependent methyltransferase [Candidatus Omnitrophota bacterium]